MPKTRTLHLDITNEINQLPVSDDVKRIVTLHCIKGLSVKTALEKAQTVENAKKTLLKNQRRNSLGRRPLQEYREMYDNACKSLSEKDPEYAIWKLWWERVLYIENNIINHTPNTTTLSSLASRFSPHFSLLAQFPRDILTLQSPLCHFTKEIYPLKT